MNSALQASTLSTYTASDGANLAIQDWPIAGGQTLRGLVLVVHGLGEHAGRYDHVAQRLNGWGFAVRGYDHYGHGDSDGVRGTLPTASRLVDDLADVIDSTRRRTDPGIPLILLGHSLGGLVAALVVASGELPVEGLVLSSPAFEVRLGAVQKALLTALPRIVPQLTVSNGLNPHFISHDPAVVAAYRADPLVHDRISASLGSFVATAGPTVLARAPQWTVPTLLMYSGADHLVNPAGSRAFAHAAPGAVVTTHCFEDFYHEIFNERDGESVFDVLKKWLDGRF